MEIFSFLAMSYIAIGVVFVGVSSSRGLVADVLFGALWPIYLAQYFTHGK
ncbi:hypothetical protein TRICHSKD4_3373 [Roseibium sp. TrichSKD4]|nr:hypothetical protein TRICHSKD4_3373 [Roseibium sp. TrichSKD4]